ncbi:MAG: hypothetical protein ABIP71_09705 [Verrucomicrobiota bacterium]
MSKKILIVLLFVVGLFAFLAIPNCARISPRSKLLPIYNNLRQLDGAKQQWSLENGATGIVQLSEQNIAPYLKRGLKDFKSFSTAGERYIINSLGTSPEAYLTKRVEGLPKGTVIRFKSNDGQNIETILPR